MYVIKWVQQRGCQQAGDAAAHTELLKQANGTTTWDDIADNRQVPIILSILKLPKADQHMESHSLQQAGNTAVNRLVTKWHQAGNIFNRNFLQTFHRCNRLATISTEHAYIS